MELCGGWVWDECKSEGWSWGAKDTAKKEQSELESTVTGKGEKGEQESTGEGKLL